MSKTERIVFIVFACILTLALIHLYTGITTKVEGVRCNRVSMTFFFQTELSDCKPSDPLQSK